jgi:hypothetical protein
MSTIKEYINKVAFQGVMAPRTKMTSGWLNTGVDGCCPGNASRSPL